MKSLPESLFTHQKECALPVVKDLMRSVPLMKFLTFVCQVSSILWVIHPEQSNPQDCRYKSKYDMEPLVLMLNQVARMLLLERGFTCLTLFCLLEARVG